VGSGDFVRLNCEPETLDALASGLTHYAPLGSQPDWLVSGIWLWTALARYIVTATVEVLPDGFVARGLSICRPEELTKRLEAELPDVVARLTARGNGMTLPRAETPSPPDHLNPWPTAHYDMQVLVRTTSRASGMNRVACGLLFTIKEGRSLLVGSDPSSLALVLSEDQELIDRYRSECDALTSADYIARG
jgi:hypothetical protein